MAYSGYIIQTKKLTKEYSKVKSLYPFRRDSFLALDSLSINIKRAEFICLLGLNGAGKTTFLKILSGILLSTGGKIYLEGEEIKDIQRLKTKIGLLNGDERSFYWRLTAKENLEFFGALYNINSKDLKKRLEKLFSLFKIKNPDKRFCEYSSGFKQKFFIIGTLMRNPDILLLDEPTKNLDYISKENLLDFIKQELVIRQKKTVVISTNGLDRLEVYDKFLILDKGKIKSQGGIEEIKRTSSISNLNIKDFFKTLCG